jgi:thioredoxin-related protein
MVYAKHGLLWLVAFMVLSFSLGVSSADAPRDPYKFFFNESFGDYSEELENAKEEGKKAIMIFFEMDDCPFCHRMKTTIMNQPAIQAYFRERFLIFAHDIEGDLDLVDFEGNETTQKDYAVKVQRVRATPVIAFFDLQGKRITRYIGATASAEEFKWLADYVADGHYKETSFTRYKREQKKKRKES